MTNRAALLSRNLFSLSSHIIFSLLLLYNRAYSIHTQNPISRYTYTYISTQLTLLETHLKTYLFHILEEISVYIYIYIAQLLPINISLPLVLFFKYLLEVKF